MNLTDIYIAFYLTVAKYIFYSSTDATFSRIDHMATEFKKTEIISIVFFGHKAIKLERRGKLENS